MKNTTEAPPAQRTDAEAWRDGPDERDPLIVSVDFARELERALVAAQAENARLKQEIATDSWTAEMQRALELIPVEFLKNDMWCEGIGRMAAVIEKLKVVAQNNEDEITDLRYELFETRSGVEQMKMAAEEYRSQLQSALSACVEMREALLRFKNPTEDGPRLETIVDNALASDSGKSILETIATLEREKAGLVEALRKAISRISGLQGICGGVRIQLSYKDWPFIFSAPNNGGDTNVEMMKEIDMRLEQAGTAYKTDDLVAALPQPAAKGEEKVTTKANL